MQLNKTILTSLLLSVATATPHHHDSDEYSAVELAPHLAREIVDKTPVLHVSTIDKDAGVPVANIERHISSDSCPELNFANNGNPILLLSRLNSTFANCQENDKDVSIAIEHPIFHGQDVFIRPRINLYGSVEELEDLSDSDVKALKKCFKRQHRATKEWLHDDDIFFAEFDVNKVWFTGDFGFGDFTGDIDSEHYHGAEAPHQPPPCPYHLPPKHDGEVSAKKHHGKHDDEISAKKHHGKHDDEISAKKHNGKHHDQEDVKKSHHEEEFNYGDSQTVFEMLKIWFNNY